MHDMSWRWWRFLYIHIPCTPKTLKRKLEWVKAGCTHSWPVFRLFPQGYRSGGVRASVNVRSGRIFPGGSPKHQPVVDPSRRRSQRAFEVPPSCRPFDRRGGWGRGGGGGEAVCTLPQLEADVLVEGLLRGQLQDAHDMCRSSGTCVLPADNDVAQVREGGRNRRREEGRVHARRKHSCVAWLTPAQDTVHCFGREFSERKI